MKRRCPICGYIDIRNIEKCPLCQSVNWEDYDLFQIKQISTDEAFVNAMIKLRDENPIEFQLKLKQFEATQTQSQRVEDNKPKCPTCGSTNIEKISVTKKVTGGFLFGLFSSDVRNTMHCKKCGHKW